MLTHEYVIRQVNGVWHVQCDGRLVSGQASEIDALHVAEALAGAAAVRGEPSRIHVGDLDGSPIEFPIIEPSAWSAIEEAPPGAGLKSWSRCLTTCRRRHSSLLRMAAPRRSRLGSPVQSSRSVAR